jgi:hypothetical protein
MGIEIQLLNLFLRENTMIDDAVTIIENVAMITTVVAIHDMMIAEATTVVQDILKS